MAGGEGDKPGADAGKGSAKGKAGGGKAGGGDEEGGKAREAAALDAGDIELLSRYVRIGGRGL